LSLYKHMMVFLYQGQYNFLLINVK
jgi:hypothetical protein